MSKKIKFDMIIEVPAGSVTAGPPIATTLGPKGVPLGLFAKSVNEQTASYNKGWKTRVRVKLFDDKSYETQVLGYTTRELLLKELNQTSGSKTPGHSNVGNLSKDVILKIAKQKFPKQSEELAYKTIEGTARSMGIKIV